MHCGLDYDAASAIIRYASPKPQFLDRPDADVTAPQNTILAPGLFDRIKGLLLRPSL